MKYVLFVWENAACILAKRTEKIAEIKYREPGKFYMTKGHSGNILQVVRTS